MKTNLSPIIRFLAFTPSVQAFPRFFAKAIMIYGDHAVDGEGHGHAVMRELEASFFKHAF